MDDIYHGKIKEHNIGKAKNLSINEKIISFLNNYFIFKKVRNPNAKEITDNILNTPENNEELPDETETKQNKSKTRQVKKYKKKLKLPK